MTRLRCRVAAFFAGTLLSASLGASLAHAQLVTVDGKTAAERTAPDKNTSANSPAIPPAIAKTPDATSLLAGKLRFALPAGFERKGLPPDGEHGTGAVYLDSTRRQMVMVTQAPIAGGKPVGDDDRQALDAALDAHQAELDAPAPNYRRLGSQALNVNGLGLRRTDGTTTFFDKRVYSTSLIAASGSQLATVVVMTPIDGAAAHQALVASILADIAAGR